MMYATAWPQSGRGGLYGWGLALCVNFGLFECKQDQNPAHDMQTNTPVCLSSPHQLAQDDIRPIVTIQCHGNDNMK